MKMNNKPGRALCFIIFLTLAPNFINAQQPMLLKLYTTFLKSSERNVQIDSYLKTENNFFDSEFKNLSIENKILFRQELVKLIPDLTNETRLSILDNSWSPSQLSSKVTCNYILHGMTLGSEPIIKAIDAIDENEILEIKNILGLMGYGVKANSEIDADTKNVINEILGQDIFTKDRRICWGTDISYRIRKKFYLDTYRKGNLSKRLPLPTKILVKKGDGPFKEITKGEFDKKMKEAEEEGCHVKEICSDEKEKSVSGEIECSNGFSFKISSNGKSFGIGYKSFSIEFENGKIKLSIETP